MYDWFHEMIQKCLILLIADLKMFNLQIYGWKPQYYNDTKDLPSDMPRSLVEYIKTVNSSRVSRSVNCISRYF